MWPSDVILVGKDIFQYIDYTFAVCGPHTSYTYVGHIPYIDNTFAVCGPHTSYT